MKLRGSWQRILSTALLGALLLAPALMAQEAGTHGYMRYPDLHGDRVVFTSSGDLWVGSARGGVASRLTSHRGEEIFASFSADGEYVAFTGNYQGNPDVYVMPVRGGQPRQLTFHGSSDEVVGWDPRGRIVFKADRLPPFRAPELYAVSPEGGHPEKLPYYRASRITFEPDGDRVAIVLHDLGFHVWNRYKGGQAEKIWVGDPAVPEFDLVSHYAGNESFPMWTGDGRIVFVSDSLGRENLWAMAPDGSSLERLTQHEDFDVRWPKLEGERIVYQHGSGLRIHDLASGEDRALEITMPTDLVEARTRFVDAFDYLRHWSLNRDGSRLVAEARGEIFTMPVKAEGLIRQWTRRSDSREKWPTFLPGSQKLMMVSDASGEERLVTMSGPSAPFEPLEREPLDDWKYGFQVSPDGRWVAYADGSQKLYLVDAGNGSRRLIAEGGWEFHDYVFSPDSRWIAYVLEAGEEEFADLYLYDIEKDESHLISDTRFRTHSPAWDPAGRYLYVVTERNYNPYQDYPRGLFYYDNVGTLALIRLRGDVVSPFTAKGDDASSGLPDAAAQGVEPGEPIEIELEGIARRYVPLSEVPGSYTGLAAAKDGFYFLENVTSGMAGRRKREEGGTTLRWFDLGKGSSAEVAGHVAGYQLSGDASTIVVRKGQSFYWGDAGSAGLAMDGDHTVATSGWEAQVVPADEWKQIVRAAWRQQREFFYDPAMHEVPWDSVLARFEPLLERVTTRDDVQDLIREVQAELNVGHAYIGAGDEPEVERAPVGLLGIDVEPDARAGAFRITRVLAPEPGTEDGASPLYHADPEAGEGTWLLAVNGHPVDPAKNLFALLQNRAGRPVALTLNDEPTLEGAREVVVQTLHSDWRLRELDFIRQKREYVQRKSGGRVGYVNLPDMNWRGIREFGRDYYPQRSLPGMILDDRYNGGGNVAEYIVKEMTTPIFAQQESRYGAHQTKPHGAYFGHVSVLINGETASDGETMAWAARQIDDWTLMGQRTWGGWVWIWPRRPLVDNAYISVPEFGGWGMQGQWLVEGPGVSPEIEVVNDPASEMQGRDPQLDAAIEHLLERIEEDPRELPAKPAKGPFTE